MVGVDDSSSQAWSEGQQPLGAVLNSSDNSQLLCHDHSTVNVAQFISVQFNV